MKRKNVNTYRNKHSPRCHKVCQCKCRRIQLRSQPRRPGLRRLARGQCAADWPSGCMSQFPARGATRRGRIQLEYIVVQTLNVHVNQRGEATQKKAGVTQTYQLHRFILK